MQYAYLHGFASSSKSVKGRELAERFDGRGVDLHLPDLNHPSFAELTYSGMVEAFDRHTREHGEPGERWRLVGSSMGGYVAARWAESHPDRTGRMVLLCPGFDMVARWAELLGDDGIERWRDEGTFLFFDPADKLTAVHWELYRDARENHPDYPTIDVPALLVHGRDDEIVPVESSREFVRRTPEARLEVLEDDHRLHDSIDSIADCAFDFFGLDD